MKKLALVLACMLTCSILLTGCTDNKGNDDHNLDNSVEIDDTDIADADMGIDTETLPGTETLPDGFTYSFRDPDNADGIVVTPKK